MLSCNFPNAFITDKKGTAACGNGKVLQFWTEMLDSGIVSKQTAWFDKNNRNNQENENFGVQK